MRQVESRIITQNLLIQQVKRNKVLLYQSKSKNIKKKLDSLKGEKIYMTLYDY